MNCPLCVTAVLDERISHGIEVDICPTCNGIWLDRGELDRLVLQAEPPAGSPIDAPASAIFGSAVSASEPKAPKPRHRDDDDDWDDDDDDDRDDDDRDDRRSSKSERRPEKKHKKKRRKDWADIIEDLFDDILDF